MAAAVRQRVALARRSSSSAYDSFFAQNAQALAVKIEALESQLQALKAELKSLSRPLTETATALTDSTAYGDIGVGPLAVDVYPVSPSAAADPVLSRYRMVYRTLYSAVSTPRESTAELPYDTLVSIERLRTQYSVRIWPETDYSLKEKHLIPDSQWRLIHVPHPHDYTRAVVVRIRVMPLTESRLIQSATNDGLNRDVISIIKEFVPDLLNPVITPPPIVRLPLPLCSSLMCVLNQYSWFVPAVQQPAVPPPPKPVHALLFAGHNLAQVQLLPDSLLPSSTASIKSCIDRVVITAFMNRCRVHALDSSSGRLTAAQPHSCVVQPVTKPLLRPRLVLGSVASVTMSDGTVLPMYPAYTCAVGRYVVTCGAPIPDNAPSFLLICLNLNGGTLELLGSVPLLLFLTLFLSSHRWWWWWCSWLWWWCVLTQSRWVACGRFHNR
jgi:hypothetical protein